MVEVGITDGRKRTRAEVSGKANEWKDLIARSSFVGEVKLFVFRCQVAPIRIRSRVSSPASVIKMEKEEGSEETRQRPTGILQWSSCHFNERPISRGFDYFFVSH